MPVSHLQKIAAAAIGPGVAFLLICAGAVRAQTSGETVTLAIGGSAIIELTANPSTGYGWRLSEAESSNLEALAISAAGFKPAGGGGAPLAGAPGVAQFRIEGRRSGAARAVFIYSRPWEHFPPAGRHIVTVNVR